MINAMKFLGELRRRHVYRVAVGYAFAGWALAQGIAQVFPVFDVPTWVVRFIVLLIALGFPGALVLAWAFDITPEGIKRTADVKRVSPSTITSARKLDFVIIGILLLTIGAFAYEHFARANSSKLDSGPTAKSVAVLPFDNLSSDQENAYFTDGVQDEILADLAKIADLKVISRTSVMQYKSGVAR